MKKVSVIIPAYNAVEDLPILIEGLKNQDIPPHEMILVDDCSTDETKKMAAEFFTVLSTPGNSGPATARNIGIARATGDYIAFMDSDCKPGHDYIARIIELFADDKKKVLAGGLTIKGKSILGKSIAALGYPGGGSLGFDKMWPVAEDGTVKKVCTGNLVVRKEVLEEIGGFDESFPDPNLEDAYFSDCLNKAGVKIYYAPEVYVGHKSRETLGSFIKWHWVRGKGICPYKEKVGKIENVIKLRIWSTKNMISAHRFDLKLPLILMLLVLSAVVQQISHLQEKRRRRK